MIAFIKGHVLTVAEQKIVVFQSGIGLELQVANSLEYNQNQEVSLVVYFYWSAENGPSLYGFVDQLHKDIFVQLIDCQGVGPKLAMTILQQKTVLELLNLIGSQDVVGLSQLKGVGTKKAETICMHLKDKINKLVHNHPKLHNTPVLGVWNDVAQALASLNYSTSEIKQATVLVKDSVAGQDLSFDLLLRKTLMVLAKK